MDKSLRAYAEKLLRMSPEEFAQEVKREGARAYAAEGRRWRQRERGLCSDRDCDEPIAGWCLSCDQLGAFHAPKWCAWHLMRHCADTGHSPYWQFDHDGGQDGGAA